MIKYMVKMFVDGMGELQEEVFDNEEDAMEYGSYLCSCSGLGAEILHLSNPGDYPDEESDSDFEVIEIED